MCSGPEVAPPLVPLECLDGGGFQISGGRVN